ncbi:RimJ/RimL family protein N-acetyltransferase [Actinoplanes lutulentus]|uniref:RimJ/RimL family protein N-acetyltransferase n=1 Tax=Actinoplanes lutulentus TaxID=1287878 RepID=A0A327YXC0_9ACTN|nr:GNAT family N-acetyltransferase [Actinoplanes lutulentus]MBB2948991.1 RimJ/RimL family protein N-acetyltransferase [Actinoplanes lutulentus]RAK26230.1 RimJ/RimL family protein N-acetyltransferase [Actinoplanes lutulentus]
MPPVPRSIVLEGRFVRLEPLAESHVPDLFVAGGQDDQVWRWLSAPTPRTEAELLGIVSRRLVDIADGKRVAFAVLSHDERMAIGTTNLHSWHRAEGRIEIGGTWFGRKWWRTAANTETKILTMTYVFETLGYAEVVWRVRPENVRSREALTRIGATPVGAAVSSMLVYRMPRAEWPAAKARLSERLVSFL